MEETHLFLLVDSWVGTNKQQLIKNTIRDPVFPSIMLGWIMRKGFPHYETVNREIMWNAAFGFWSSHAYVFPFVMWAGSVYRFQYL